MEKFILKLSTLFKGADKVLHFVVGMLVAILVLVVTGQEWLGFSVAFLLGLYKEFSDHTKGSSVGGKSTWLDWLSTMGGALLIELIW